MVSVTREQATRRISKLFGLEAEQTIDMFKVAETEDLEVVTETYLFYLDEYVSSFDDDDEF